jgi:hypothetical protein
VTPAFALLPLLAAAQPARLDSFEALMKAANSGQQIRTVIDYSKTTLIIEGKEQKAPAAIGGMLFRSWEYFAPGVVRNKLAYLVSSETHLIGHPSYGYVNNYVRLRFYSDNKVEITARYLDPKTYEVKMDETFMGAISNGKDQKGVSLFAAP